ncbi:MAG: lamin tail domain-containing protein, partial [Candidatus Latescibacteria bacterium]|nr:lamin tail domain-containing protein [Candidatus Latescibacterota bacterium]
MLRSEVPVPAAAVAIRSRAITPSGSRTAALALAGILAVAAGPAGADLLLNEVLYDPLGADDGAEFVELMNPDSLAVPLGGVVVEVCDGARPGAWTPAHVFAPGDTVPARGLYLVAGPSLLVAMQNGPDAVRLTRGGSVLDLLGYGDLAAPELYEGEPAADAASGESLARLRDGVDTEWNASDWAPEPIPTPGRPNHPDVRVAFVPGSVRASPEVSWPGEGVALAAFVKNLGRVEIEGSRWSAEVSIRFGAAASDTTGGSPAGGSAPGDSPWSAEPIATTPGTTLAPGESVAVVCRFLAPAPGPFALRSVLRDLLASGAEGVGSSVGTGIGSAGWTGSVVDTAVVPSRSVAGPLVVNEFAFRDRGFGEWVEILALEAVPDIGAFAISDAGGVPRAIERGPVSRGAREGDL